MLEVFSADLTHSVVRPANEYIAEKEFLVKKGKFESITLDQIKRNLDKFLNSKEDDSFQEQSNEVAEFEEKPKKSKKK